jgi:uncharacterized protein
MMPIYLNFRYKRINNKYLITNDYFDWLFITKNELSLLKEKKVKADTKLYKNLVKNNFIVDPKDNRSGSIIENARKNLSLPMTGPSLHIVVLTKRCNQSCIYCHAASTREKSSKKYDLTINNAKRFTEIIMSAPNHAITIEFQGGEPLLNFNVLKYIYEYSIKLNKKLKKDLTHTVVTNLEAMDDEKLDYLIKNKISICTSLDGPKALHDANRPSARLASSYDNAINWIKKCKTKEIIVSALATISKKSLSYPKEIIDEYIKQGYNHIHLRELSYLGKAAGIWREIGYTADEFIKFWKKAIDYIIKLNIDGKYFSERTCVIMLQKIISKKEPYYLDLMSPCGAIIGQIAYNYDGKIYTCDEARAIGDEIFQIGNQDAKSIKKIISQEKSLQIISSTINDAYYCNYCAYKPYCGVCPVCNYMEKQTPLCDVLETSRCKVLMAMFDHIFKKLQDPKTNAILESWVNEKFYKDSNIFF